MDTGMCFFIMGLHCNGHSISILFHQTLCWKPHHTSIPIQIQHIDVLTCHTDMDINALNHVSLNPNSNNNGDNDFLENFLENSHRIQYFIMTINTGLGNATAERHEISAVILEFNYWQYTQVELALLVTIIFGKNTFLKIDIVQAAEILPHEKQGPN